MSCQSPYEINVSKDGKHLFATAPRSGVALRHSLEALTEIRSRFPKHEGWEVTMTHWDCKGTRYQDEG